MFIQKDDTDSKVFEKNFVQKKQEKVERIKRSKL